MINFLNEEVKIEAYKLLLPLALILLLSKGLSILCKKLNFPTVVGMILAGILIGLLQFTPLNDFVLPEDAKTGIKFIAEIGVILIMFEAGIETDIKQIKETGLPAVIITILGVIVPLLLGFLAAGIFFGFNKDNVYKNLFYGVILTATSVSVTVAALKELGKLNSKIGTAITSAAILDDILGIIVLSVILSLATGEGSIAIVLLKTIGFFAFVIILGMLVRYAFKMLAFKYNMHRRVPIFSIGICFFFAFIAEYLFGIADITGAYAAGLLLSGLSTSDYVEKKADMMSYLFFTPIFFANIGINLKYEAISTSILGFGIVFVVVGMLGKFIGCGLGAKITGFSMKDSYRCGIGMMCRAEVCLISAAKGESIIGTDIQPFIVALIIITSFVTPLLLKLSYKNEKIDFSVDNKKLEKQ